MGETKMGVFMGRRRTCLQRGRRRQKGGWGGEKHQTKGFETQSQSAHREGTHSRDPAALSDGEAESREGKGSASRLSAWRQEDRIRPLGTGHGRGGTCPADLIYLTACPSSLIYLKSMWAMLVKIPGQDVK